MKKFYQEINTAIIEGRDISSSTIKDIFFYNYLLDNRVASYYCKNISKQQNDLEKSIIDAGNSRNNMFLKTLIELDRICKEQNIDYLLYKTHKYFDEVIGGDIDIIVKDEDFDRFLRVFSLLGWNCEEDEKRKGKCEKDGFIVIEPHVNISWNGNTFFESSKLWKNIENVIIEGNNYKKTNKSFESLSIYLKIMYEPEYLDLYDYLVLKHNGVNIKEFESILKGHNQSLIVELNNMIHSIKKESIYPYFFSSTFIFKCNVLNFLKIGYLNKRMFIHNFYWKLRYRRNQKLPYLTKYIKL